MHYDTLDQRWYRLKSGVDLSDCRTTGKFRESKIEFERPALLGSVKSKRLQDGMHPAIALQ